QYITTEYPPSENVTPDINITTIYTPDPDNVTSQVDITTTPVPSFDMAPPIQVDELGIVTGIVIQGRFASPINAYLRIPYAKPPIEELRFKDPEPAETLGERGNPTIDMPKCVQYSEEEQDIVGEEDCLYLNVYVPAQSDTDSALKPVMVFIHGGTFDQGSGRLDQFDPRFLLTEDVIVVTMNFRLGIFGFFHLDDETVGTPGNAALKDQQLALAWVREHISHFGGDEENISIFGQGAGAASVHLHILSPRSTGLFNKAIIQSGTAISPWVMGTENNGDKLAKELELTTENYEELLNTLRTKEAREIFTAAK
ncbi:hydrolase, partial [Oryctes borbonicus]